MPRPRVFDAFLMCFSSPTRRASPQSGTPYLIHRPARQRAMRASVPQFSSAKQHHGVIRQWTNAMCVSARIWPELTSIGAAAPPRAGRHVTAGRRCELKAAETVRAGSTASCSAHRC